MPYIITHKNRTTTHISWLFQCLSRLQTVYPAFVSITGQKEDNALPLSREISRFISLLSRLQFLVNGARNRHSQKNIYITLNWIVYFPYPKRAVRNKINLIHFGYFVWKRTWPWRAESLKSYVRHKNFGRFISWTSFLEKSPVIGTDKTDIVMSKAMLEKNWLRVCIFRLDM